MRVATTCLLALFAAVVRSETAVRYEAREEEISVKRLFGDGNFTELDTFSRLLESGGKVSKATHLHGFSWSNCGDPRKEMLVVEAMSITPNPISLPGTLNIAFRVNVNKTLNAPLKVQVELEKKFLVWIRVPCIDNIGSCTYNDICSMLSKAPCPAIFKTEHVPCKCPYKQGLYKLSNAAISIGAQIPRGDYRLTAKLSMNGMNVGCYKMSVTFA